MGGSSGTRTASPSKGYQGSRHHRPNVLVDQARAACLVAFGLADASPRGSPPASTSWTVLIITTPAHDTSPAESHPLNGASIESARTPALLQASRGSVTDRHRASARPGSLAWSGDDDRDCRPTMPTATSHPSNVLVDQARAACEGFSSRGWFPRGSSPASTS